MDQWRADAPQAYPQVVEWLVDQFAAADPKLGVSAMTEIFHWYAERAPLLLQRYAKTLHNINGAPTGNEQSLHPSVTLIPGVGHFVAQVKPVAFNQALEHIVENKLTGR